MSQLEYLVALVSIIVALALADLAGSFRELVRPRRSVRWHWLPLTWALIVLLILVQFWWTSFGTLRAEAFGQALAFLPYLLASLMLYLACAFALPDPECRPECAPERNPGSDFSMDTSLGETEALNMEAFYFSATHRQWFFGTLIVLLVLGQVIAIMSSVFLGDSTAADVAITATTNLTAAAVLGVLIATDRRWVHTGLTIFMLGATMYTFATGLPSLS